MNDIIFTATSRGKFSGGGLTCRCAIGKGGMIGAGMKREGDGASPIGLWQMKRVFYRADRLKRPETGLPCVALRETDGWCDASDHRLYNRPVTLPFTASHERLWREDHVYDLVVELNHNSDPVKPNLGSAIFFHLARPDFKPTEGCIAIAQEDMLAVLALCGTETKLDITLA